MSTLQTLLFLLSALLLTLATGLPILSPSHREVSSNGSCSTSQPKAFTISRFSTFVPASGNTTPPQITFSYNDDSGLVSAICLLKGSTESSSNTPALCSNADVSFLLKGHELTVYEMWGGNLATANTAPQHEKGQVQGTIYVGTYCYPSPAGVPLGAGTSCQMLSVSLGGSLA